LHAWFVIRVGTVMSLLCRVVHHRVCRRVRRLVGVRMILSELVVVVKGVVTVWLILTILMVR